jgi:hypothetical protein
MDTFEFRGTFHYIVDADSLEEAQEKMQLELDGIFYDWFSEDYS